MANIRIVRSRAPGLIPSLIDELGKVGRAGDPLVLIPESFTLACETEIVNHSPEQGIFDLKIFSPSGLVRQVRELTGHGSRTPVSADGQNMIFSRLLHHHKAELHYYRDAVSQPALPRRIAVQINDFARARLTPKLLADFSNKYLPKEESRRTRAKIEDLALLWQSYMDTLGDTYEDAAGQWLSALEHIGQSGLLNGSTHLLVYGFDYITHDLLNLILAALPYCEEIVIGLVCDDMGPDRDIFRAANDSVSSLLNYLSKSGIRNVTQQDAPLCPPSDPGIHYVEKTLYAYGPFAPDKADARSDAGGSGARRRMEEADLPDFGRVRAYYAKNSYLECQHTCQTLIEWHQSGIPWQDMAVAVCEKDTLPALLPLTLKAAGIPFNAKQDRPILMSAYAQYVLSLLRILRLNFCRGDVLRMIKTGYSPLSEADGMDMENYARRCGIHRSRWLHPFYMAEDMKPEEKEKTEHLEAMRRALVEPITELGAQLKGATGREAAELLFRFITNAGVYDKLLQEEEALAAQGDDEMIDRNRQVWTAVNDLLDAVASFIGDEPLPLNDLCSMLEASIASRAVKALPQHANAVTVAPPQMFFSSGVRCMIVMGLQESEISGAGGILSENERCQLEKYIEETSGEQTDAEHPYSRIGQSLPELAARQKQDVYQAVSLAREQLMLSCSSMRPSGGVLTRSTAFKRLYDVIAGQNPGNATGGLMNPDIRPFAPAFALEMLARKLRDIPEESAGFLVSGTDDDRRWQYALSDLYRSGEWRTRTQAALDGLRIAPPAGHITPECAEALYAGHVMSISRVETFSRCPWQHLLQYGLDLVPNEDFEFESSDEGNFNHEVIKQFLDEAMRLPGWPDVSEEVQNRLLNRILREKSAKWAGGVLRSDLLHRFQGVGYIRSIRTALQGMMRTFRNQPHFVPFAAEVPFGMTDSRSTLRLPAITIPMPDGDDLIFSGKIDRIDRVQLPDGRSFFMIIDNKLSEKKVRLGSLEAGLQLQLPLYIRAAQNGLHGLMPAGGLYQPVRTSPVEMGSTDSMMKALNKQITTNGMILEDKDVQAAMMPVSTGRGKQDDSDIVHAVTPDELQALTDKAVHTVAAQVSRMRAGETAPRPLQDGLSPCGMCRHSDACPFDTTLPGCRIYDVNHKTAVDPAAKDSE